jgi:diadenosine tetraphosphate (Ap4A) HIT family hydrolase
MEQPVLKGSGIIIPKAHRATVFDLTPEEWAATYELLGRVRAKLEQELRPDGYNVGWNCGKVGGQEIHHAHLHVIPRFADEPFAGKGIRHWLKSDANRRPAGG